MSYELFYSFVTTTTSFEFWCFIIWFGLDLAGTLVAIHSTIPKSHRLHALLRSVLGVGVGVLFFWTCTKIWPDEREQITAYWTGILLQLPVGWFSVYFLLKRGDCKGQGLEIWYLMTPLHPFLIALSTRFVEYEV